MFIFFGVDVTTGVVCFFFFLECPGHNRDKKLCSHIAHAIEDT